MKIYLDDERKTPDGYTRCYWPEEVIEWIKKGNVTEVSLDHDLGDDDHGTEYDALLWIEEQVAVAGMIPPKMYVHSSNSSAKHKMYLAIANIEKLAERNLTP